jgi:metal-responsive CopG/Arc/MetJ family transcriptional regulator
MHLSDYEISKFEKGNLTATILAMCQKQCPHLDDLLLHLIHGYEDIVEGNLYLHVGGEPASEVFVTEGNADRVSIFIVSIGAIKGIEQVKYPILPLL